MGKTVDLKTIVTTSGALLQSGMLIMIKTAYEARIVN
jgi:hypothetical protein